MLFVYSTFCKGKYVVYSELKWMWILLTLPLYITTEQFNISKACTLYIISQSGEVFSLETHFSIRQSFRTKHIYCEENVSNINYVFFIFWLCIRI
jgi:uncharacterized protein (DUF779 family)